MKRAPRVLDRRGDVAAFDSHYTGFEPEWPEGLSYEETARRMARGLGFYAYYCDNAVLRGFLVDWMKKNGYTRAEVSAVSSAPSWGVSATAGKLARMLQRGMPDLHPDALSAWEARQEENPESLSEPPKSASALIREMVSEVWTATEKAPVPAVVQETAPPVSSPKDPLSRLEEKVNREIIKDLDALIDDIAAVPAGAPPGRLPRLDVGSLLRSRGIPAKGAAQVSAWIERALDELRSAYDRSCPQAVEGYSCYPRPHQKKMIENWEAMLLEAKTHGKAKSRTQRVKKPKSAERLVAKLHYKAEDETLGLKSVSPLSLPYAQRAYIFNTNTRQLCIYIAAGRDGLSVKGSTLSGFDPEKSSMIRLRKPGDVIPAILSSSTKKIDKDLAALKTKAFPANGRVNKHMIILKTFKEL